MKFFLFFFYGLFTFFFWKCGPDHSTRFKFFRRHFQTPETTSDLIGNLVTKHHDSSSVHIENKNCSRPSSPARPLVHLSFVDYLIYFASDQKSRTPNSAKNIMPPNDLVINIVSKEVEIIPKSHIWKV